MVWLCLCRDTSINCEDRGQDVPASGNKKDVFGVQGYLAHKKTPTLLGPP